MNACFITFFFFFTMTYVPIATSPLLLPFFSALKLPFGVTIRIVLYAVCIVVFMLSRDKKEVLKKIAKLGMLWLPWLAYLLFRCTYSDVYSFNKLIYIYMHFLTLPVICVMFTVNPERFNKYLFIFTLGMSMALLIVFVLNPTIIIVSGNIERLGTENVGPIWIARNFSLTVLFIILFSRFPIWIKSSLVLIFFVSIIPTGTRGPLLSLIIILGLLFLLEQRKKRAFFAKAISCICFAIALFWISFPFFEASVNKYFHRGSSKTMFQQSGRADLYKLGIKEFATSPIFGVGLGRYGKENKTGRSVINKNIEDRVYPHNIIIEVLAELGIVGLFLFFLILYPGKWMFDFSNKYLFIFLLTFLFVCTSGDLKENGIVFIFNYIAIMNYHKNIKDKQQAQKPLQSLISTK